MVLAKTTLKPAVETNTMLDFRVRSNHSPNGTLKKKSKKNQRVVPSTSLPLNIGSAPMRLEEAFLIDPQIL